MKNLLLILIILAGSFAFAQDVDVPAEYPGGKPALMKFLANNMIYPKTAIEADLQGKCWLRLTIEADGTISNAIVRRGVPECPECDAESLRVVSLMPKWVPATKNGVAVTSFFDFPLNFSIQ